MLVGIIGLPNSGKTTVFNALTRSQAATATFGGPAERNLAVVKVPDRRLDALAPIFKPKKTVPAEVTYVDLGVTISREQGISGQGLADIAGADELLHVVRAFDDPRVPHPLGSVDPLRDLENFDLELTFSDLAIVERRLQRTVEMIHKVKPVEREAMERERDLLARLRQPLEEGHPIRVLSFSEEEEKVLRNFQFLTVKPLLVVVNVGEDRLARPGELAEQVRERYRIPKTEVVELCGKLEMEIAQLPEEDVPEFLAELGIAEPGLNRAIKASYHLLGLQSFFTGGPKEVRAWTIRQGETAQKAAGAIHSDMERGFIRAEVVGYEDMVACGSIAEARRRGLLRLEGKNYLVRDGDVITFLFNV